MSCFQLNQLCNPTSLITNISACSEFYLAVPLNDKGNIAIWNLLCPLEKPTILIGHHRTVTAVALSNYPDHNYLCSCSSDNIILWNLLQNGGKPDRGKVLLSNVERPSYCCFSWDNLTVAVCSNNDVLLLGLMENKNSILIEQGSLMCFCCFIWDSMMLTADENSLMKAWDLKAGVVQHQKRISPGFLNVVFAHIKSTHVAVGTSCGNLYVYGKEFNCIREIQIWRILKHYLDHEDCNEEVKINFESDCNFPVQAIHLFNLEEDTLMLDNFLPGVLYAIVVTSSCLIILNLNIEAVVYFLDFNGDALKVGDTSSLGLIKSASISLSRDDSTAFVALASLIGRSVIILKINLVKALTKSVDEKIFEPVGDYEKKYGSNKALTFLHSGRSENGHSLLNHNIANSMNISEKSNKGKIHNRSTVSNVSFPVTYHDKIKSSGYGNINRRVLFQPQINKSFAHPQKCSTKHFHQPLTRKSLKLDALFVSDTSFNPVDSEFLSKLNFRNNPGFMSLHIETEGNHVCCTSAEGVVDIMKIGRNNIKLANTISGHKNSVNSAKWSHSNKMLVSSSSDQTVKLWSLENLKKEPILTLGCHPSKECVGTIAKKKFIFDGVVDYAQFYYLDKFVIASSGNTLYLFDYIINSKKTDLKRYGNNSQHKLVIKIPIDSKRITSVMAVNQFHSNLVLCAGSSKSIDTFDMTTGSVTWHAEDVGTKPAHIIAINEGSPNVNQAVSLYDLFLTAALFDGIKIWDIRTKRPVMRYKEHRCRCIPCGASFSSCGKYIASGSEDNSVYIYDLRMTSCLHKLTEHHSDVIASVAFSPSKKQLLASSLNGTVYLYGEKEIM